MKLNRLGGCAAALCIALTVAVAAGPVAALASGIWTNGATLITAAQVTGSETQPLDTNYAGGASPQSAAITLAAQKTYSNGGAIVQATASSGAATANGEAVTVTSEALTTAAAAVYTLTLTDSSITALTVPLCTVGMGTNTTVGPTLTGVTPAAGSVVILVRNGHASAAFNGTIEVNCRFIN